MKVKAVKVNRAHYFLTDPRTLCICKSRESLQQGFVGRAVLLYEKIRNSGKVCATCTGCV